jgi:hypothetical protein
MVQPLKERLVHPEHRNLKELLDGMFEVDPARRTKPAEALQSNFFVR